MAFPVPHFHPTPPPPLPEPPAMVRAAAREDAMWDRPIFKAPPLQLHPQAFDAKIFAQELSLVGLVAR